MSLNIVNRNRKCEQIKHHQFLNQMFSIATAQQHPGTRMWWSWQCCCWIQWLGSFVTTHAPPWPPWTSLVVHGHNELLNDLHEPNVLLHDNLRLRELGRIGETPCHWTSCYDTSARPATRLGGGVCLWHGAHVEDLLPQKSWKSAHGGGGGKFKALLLSSSGDFPENPRHYSSPPPVIFRKWIPQITSVKVSLPEAGSECRKWIPQITSVKVSIPELEVGIEKREVLNMSTIPTCRSRGQSILLCTYQASCPLLDRNGLQKCKFIPPEVEVGTSITI